MDVMLCMNRTILRLLAEVSCPTNLNQNSNQKNSVHNSQLCGDLTKKIGFAILIRENLGWPIIPLASEFLRPGILWNKTYNEMIPKRSNVDCLVYDRNQV